MTTQVSEHYARRCFSSSTQECNHVMDESSVRFVEPVQLSVDRICVLSVVTHLTRPINCTTLTYRMCVTHTYCCYVILLRNFFSANHKSGTTKEMCVCTTREIASEVLY